jgi:PTS system N-acetylgalactosamine-specific IIC component
MEFNVLQIILVFVWAFIIGIDQFDLTEALYRPIVSGAVVGLILGDLKTGLAVGAAYELMSIGSMPIGGAQPPNAVIGGIMAVVFAISSNLEAEAALGLAIPFAIVGQNLVTLLFTVMSPMMSVADKMAAKGDHKGIVKLNWAAMGILGLSFAIVCTIGMVGGAALGDTLAAVFTKAPWIMKGLSTAGGMMCLVGFATLLRIMMSADLWPIYLVGFAMALALTNVAGIAGNAMLLLVFIGIALALNDYKTSVALKNAGANGNGGDDDGI